MITCQLMGGLGNQLFQIATTIAYAIRWRHSFVFTNAKTLGQGATTIRPTYWDTFLSRLRTFTRDTFADKYTTVREAGFHYTPLTLPENAKSILLYGYFQSYLYFEDQFSTIERLLSLREKQQVVWNKTPYPELSQYVSMHFRRGDYKKLQECHPLLLTKYYEDSLSFILQHRGTERTTVLYFCEEEDNAEVGGMVNALQQSFPLVHFERCANQWSDWEQLLIMSGCRDHIIANSSFSWWGAYFNANPAKLVCYPSTWFGPAMPHETRDLFPPTWTCIQCHS